MISSKAQYSLFPIALALDLAVDSVDRVEPNPL